MTSSTSADREMDITKLLSQLSLTDVSQIPTAAITADDSFHRLNSTGNLRSDGRRLLGRSMTTTASPMTPCTQGQSFIFSVPAEDTTAEIPESYRSHRKLDRSVSEPHPNAMLARNGSLSSSSSSPSSSSRYKTELCRPFEENGSCKYGEKCQFAHGRNELRTVARHPKYKTDLCKTYHTTGLCPYGPRCHFIHNDEERYLNIINRIILQQQMAESMIEKAQLAQKQQAIVTALEAQKALQQAGARKASLRQTSSDACIASEQPRLPFPFVSCDPLCSSISDSSSVTDSPTPSPTSSMFSEDPVALAASSALNGFRTPVAFGFSPTDIRRFPQAYQPNTTESVQPAGTSSQPMALALLLAKLQASPLGQQDVATILDILMQKSSTSVAASPSISTSDYSSATCLPPFSPSAQFSGDFVSRDNTCFSWPYSAVEL